MIVFNNVIPLKGFVAFAVWPFIFVRKEKKFTTLILNHENIHFEQQKELLLIFFYLLYFIFWIIYGYKNIPFEKEAYTNEGNQDYLKDRKFMAWVKYFGK